MTADYYVVVIGGRYGSLLADGVSFTEKEYNYAVEQNIPVLAFLQKPQPDCGEGSESRGKLAKFCQRVERNRNVELWSTRHELRAAVAESLANACKNIWRPGWVRGDAINAGDEDVLKVREFFQLSLDGATMSRFHPGNIVPVKWFAGKPDLLKHAEGFCDYYKGRN